MKYKKYILFCFEGCYPGGGLGDIRDSYDSLEEARDAMAKDSGEYRYVVDRDTWEEVANADF